MRDLQPADGDCYWLKCLKVACAQGTQLLVTSPEIVGCLITKGKLFAHLYVHRIWANVQLTVLRQATPWICHLNQALWWFIHTCNIHCVQLGLKMHV